MVDWYLIDHSWSNQSPLDAQGRLDMDAVSPDLKNMQFKGLVDLIHLDHPNPEKKISWCNEVLANKNEVDEDEIDKNEAESHMIGSTVTLALQWSFFYIWVLSNIALVSMFWVVSLVILYLWCFLI